MKKKNLSTKSIHDFEDSFFDKSLMIKYKSSVFASIDVIYVLTFVRKRGVVYPVDFTYTKSLLDI